MAIFPGQVFKRTLYNSALPNSNCQCWFSNNGFPDWSTAMETKIDTWTRFRYYFTGPTAQSTIRQVGTGPPATTLPTRLWLYCHLRHIEWLRRIMFERGREVADPLVSLLLAGSPSHITGISHYESTMHDVVPGIYACGLNLPLINTESSWHR